MGPSKLGRYSYQTVRLANMGIVGDDRADTQLRGSSLLLLLSLFFSSSSLVLPPASPGQPLPHGSCLLLALSASYPFSVVLFSFPSFVAPFLFLVLPRSVSLVLLYCTYTYTLYRILYYTHGASSRLPPLRARLARLQSGQQIRRTTWKAKCWVTIHLQYCRREEAVGARRR